MIINRSYHIVYPFIKNNIDMRYEAFNSYLYHDKYNDTITISINYSNDTKNDGYNRFGFIDFDKYLRNHYLYIEHQDKSDYINYTLSVPNEINSFVSDIWHGDYEFVTNYHYNNMSQYGQLQYEKMKNNDIPLKRYWKYERV